MRTRLIALLILALAVPAAAQAPAPAGEPRAVLRALEDAFAAIADRATPAVVHVSAVPRKGSAPGGEEAPERFREFFGDELFERFFRRRPREESRAAGSGLIVDPNGYILTNYHVIENAAEITVRLSDARKLSARLVGRDPKTDLAVLKVESPTPLPAAELGDSDRLRVGQWAIAIGNPFGLERTVTVGIISGTARTRVGVATYENFIQTDASINPGNSGGPLLNLDGRVIGINTAIVASGQGIGFAIPINDARDVMRQLIASGRVVRGWLGLVIQDVTGDLAQSFGVKEREGVLVADVMVGSPAEAAGLRRGDVVTGLGAERIREVPELQRRVARVTPGERVEIEVVREGRSVRLTVTVGEMPGEASPVASAGVLERFGLEVEAGPAGTSDPSAGVRVTAVTPEGAGARAGLRPGDLILEVDRRPLTDPDGLAAALGALRPGQTALLYVRRPDPAGHQYLVLGPPPP